MHDRPLLPPARVVYAVLALAVSVVHVAEAAHHLADHPSLAAGLLGLGSGLGVASLSLWRTGGRRSWQAAGALSAVAASCYVASRLGIVAIGHEAEWGASGIAATLAAVAIAWASSRAAPLAVSMPRRAVAILAASMLFAGSAIVAQAGSADAPGGCVTPSRHTTLYAEELPRSGGRIRLGYGFTPATASSPGPLIEMMEGECLAVTLVNQVSEETLRELRDDPETGSLDPELPLGVSLHVHGVKYTTLSDGTVHTGSYVPPGQARTYIWYAAPRASVAGRVTSLGTAGYWWYHDHVAGTDHGTGGLASGLFGGLVVRRPGDLRPDRSYTVVFGPDATINLRRYPQTFTCEDDPSPATCFDAVEGERIEFVVVGVGDEFHTFHLHGHNWADTRTGFLGSQLDESRLIDAKTIGPSETFGFQIVAGESVGTGNWMLHCHVQEHSDLGMVSFFRVRAANGTVPEPPAMGGHEHGAP